MPPESARNRDPRRPARRPPPRAGSDRRPGSCGARGASATSLGRNRAVTAMSISNPRLSGGANSNSARAPGKSSRSGTAPRASCACQLVPSSESTRSDLDRCSTSQFSQRRTSPSRGASTASPFRSKASARGCVKAVDGRFAETPAEDPPDEPLNLDSPGRPHRHELGETVLHAVGPDPYPLELLRRQHAPIDRRRGTSEPAPDLARGSRRQARDVAGDVQLRFAQAHQHVQPRHERRPPTQRRALSLEVAVPLSRALGVRRVQVGSVADRRSSGRLPAAIARRLPRPRGPRRSTAAARASPHDQATRMNRG